MELLGYQKRWWLDSGSLCWRTTGGISGTSAVDTTAGQVDGIHGPTCSAIETRFSRTRVQHHVTVSTTKPFGARARVLVRSRALARPSVQARFVSTTVVQICGRKKKMKLTILRLREHQRRLKRISSFSFSDSVLLLACVYPDLGDRVI